MQVVALASQPEAGAARKKTTPNFFSPFIRGFRIIGDQAHEALETRIDQAKYDPLSIIINSK